MENENLDNENVQDETLDNNTNDTDTTTDSDNNTENTENTDNQNADNNAADGGKEKDTADNKELYGSPESFDYSEIKLPEGMELDKEMLGKFEPIAKELNLSNKSANKLMGLAVELVGKNAPNLTELATQYQEAEKNSYKQLLAADKELPQNQEEYNKYLSIANSGIEAVATQGFKNLLLDKGLVNHPEAIKTFYAIGKLCQNDTPAGTNNPVGQTESAADILYGKNEE